MAKALRTARSEREGERATVTTFQVSKDAGFAEALSDVIRTAHLEAVTGLSELRTAMTPGNGSGVVAALSWVDRAPVAVALRAAADGHPLADRLRGLADSLDASVAEQRVNHPV